MVNVWEFSVTLGDKLSPKKINTKKTVIVRKKVECMSCKKYYTEYNMLYFILKNRKKEVKKNLENKRGNLVK